MDILKTLKNKSIFHKALSLFVCAVMILSVFTVSIVARADSTNVWDGSVSTSLKGSGTAADPYLIENGSDLRYMVESNNVATDAADTSYKYYKITKDIYLNNVASDKFLDAKEADLNAQGYNGWFTGSNSSGFFGELDGAGHTVYGLYYENTSTNKTVGLIPTVMGGTIKNLNLKDSCVGANWAAGGIVGYKLGATKPLTVTNCSVDNSKIVTTTSVRCGGIVGGAGTVGTVISISNCAVTNSTIKCHSSGYPNIQSSLLGYIGDKTGTYTVTNCFTGNAGHPVTHTNNTTNFAKYTNYITYTNVYTDADHDLTATGVAKLTASQMKGEAAKTNMQGFDFTSVWKTVENGYPTLVTNNKKLEVEVWSGNAATSFADGTGESGDPYIIENADQLYYLVSEVSKANNADFSKNKHFKITKDIYINDVTNGAAVQTLTNPKSWGNGLTAPDTGKKNYFYGTLDGDGHVIYGLYVYDYINPGLFGAIANGAVVKNLGFDNLYFEGGKGSGGAIAGYANYAGLSTTNPAKIEKCYVVNGSMVAGSSNKLANAGGFIGNASNATIEFSNCYVYNVNFSASTCNASMIGKKTDQSTVKVYNSYFIGKFPVTTTGSGHNTTKYYNVYTDQDIIAKSSTDADEVIAKLSLDQMKGEAAKTNMQGFDFTSVWKTVENGYPIFSINDENIWDGSKSTSLEQFEGKGTATEPYLIKTGAELAYVVSTNLDDGLYFKLANDIKLNNISKANWKDTARNWVWENVRFVGTFDGDGHTIEGLYFKGDQKRMGLFSYIGDSVIKNVNFKGAYIENSTSEEGQAIVAAQASAKADFENIYIDATCEIKAPNVKGVAGIIARSDQNITIKNCAVLGTFAGKSHVGAFFGTHWGSGAISISNCFSASNAPVVSSRTPTVVNTYATVKTDDNYHDKDVVLLTPDQMKGEAVKTNMSGLDFDTIWQTVENSYPIINLREVAPKDIWDGSKATSLEQFEGKGTATEPYLIKTGAELAYVVSTNLDDGLYFKLANDIKLNNTSKADWKTTARNWVWADVRFVGTFDGDGHTIDGLYFNGSQKRFGLFSYVGDSLIKNLKISNAYINNTFTSSNADAEGMGIICAQASAKADFEYIYIDATCSLNAPNIKGVAGIVGRSNQNITIKNCAVLGTFTGKSHVSSFLGTFWGGSQTISNSYSAANVPVTTSRTPTVTNTYATVKTDDNYYDKNVVLLTPDQMKGEAAKTNMLGLDFDEVFKVVDGNYPVIELRKVVPPPVLPDYVWDGTKADSFAGGDGSEKSPFLISTPEQLYKMVAEYSTYDASNGVYFKITEDIYLNDVKDGTLLSALTYKNNWLKNYGSEVPAASKANAFNGILDGGNHTIYGLYIEGADNAGLFPAISSYTVVKNLAFNNVLITGGGAGGALAGQAIYRAWQSAAAVTNCSVVNATIGVDADKEFAGGLVGNINECSLTLANCYSYGLSLSNWASKGTPGGLVGNAWSSGTLKIVTSYSAGYFPVNSNVSKAQCTDVYTNVAIPDGNTTVGVTVLTDAKMKGDAAKTNMTGFDFNRSWQTVENGYPIHYVYVKPSYIWDGSTADSFAGGTGTVDDPFLISNGAELYKMVKEYSNASGEKDSINKQYYFKLTNDIYLNDVTADDLATASVESWNTKFNSWHKVTSYSKGFCGDLNGAGFTVYGLYSNTGYSGLIPVLLDGGKVHHLNIKNAYVYGSEAAGTIVGFVKAHYTLSPVEASYNTVDNVVVSSNKKYVGGIVGGFADISITINDSSVTRAKLSSTNENPKLVSGFIGTGWGNVTHTITNCFTDSSVNPVTATTDKEQFDIIADKSTYTNVYTSAAKNFDQEGITYVKESELKGAAAENTLIGFNFNEDWSLVDGDFPIVKKNAGEWRYDTTKPGEVWSGKISASYASGDGTKENPYIIKTGGQLALLANDALNGKTLGRYYKITEDIILNDTSKANWQLSANEWFTGSWAKAFRGHLDGNYHIISGLYLNKTKNNYDGTNYYGGLFACIGLNAVIEKLGIVNSNLTFTDDLSTKYLGVFAGFVDQYNAATAGYDEYPLIRECFADTSVYLDGGSCGGFIGCATRPIRVEDSFFTGTVKTVARGLFGYSKMGTECDEILVKNFYAADSRYAVLSNTSYDNFKYENCYSSSAQDLLGLTRLFIDRMCGEAAKTYMKGLDFENVWVVRADNETPGLKGFDQSRFSNIMNPADIVVNFETNCDLVVNSMTGKAYSKLELPVLEREGYIFEGWYAYSELDVAYTFDYFPTFDVILYAKWTLKGFEQNFEQYEDSMYDYHEDYEYYRPTANNYTAKYVHGGGKSMHRLGLTDDEQDFLLFYKEELEIGKKYKMTFYTTTDQASASVDVSLVHLEWPDVYCDNIGVEKMGTISNLTDGEWQAFTFTFTVRSKWVAIRTSGENSVYFDDFVLFDVGEGVITPLANDKDTDKDNKDDIPETNEPQNNNNGNSQPENPVITTPEKDGLSTIWIIAIVAGSVVALAAITFVVILLIRKKKLFVK